MELKAFHNKPLERAEELVWLNNEQIVSELLVLVYLPLRVGWWNCDREYRTKCIRYSASGCRRIVGMFFCSRTD
jgi:hypothetical protein